MRPEEEGSRDVISHVASLSGTDEIINAGNMGSDMFNCTTESTFLWEVFGEEAKPIENRTDEARKVYDRYFAMRERKNRI